MYLFTFMTYMSLTSQKENIKEPFYFLSSSNFFPEYYKSTIISDPSNP